MLTECRTCHSTNDPCYCNESKPALSVVLDAILRIEDLSEIFCSPQEQTLLDLGLEGRNRVIHTLKYAVGLLKAYEPIRFTSEHDLIDKRAAYDEVLTNRLGDVRLPAQVFADPEWKAAAQRAVEAERVARVTDRPDGRGWMKWDPTSDELFRCKIMREFIHYWRIKPLESKGSVQYRVLVENANHTAQRVETIDLQLGDPKSPFLVIKVGDQHYPWHDIDDIIVELPDGDGKGKKATTIKLSDSLKNKGLKTKDQVFDGLYGASKMPPDWSKIGVSPPAVPLDITKLGKIPQDSVGVWASKQIQHC